MECCLAWCFVDAACPSAVPSTAHKGLYVTYQDCANEAEALRACPAWDGSARVNARSGKPFMLVKDHGIVREIAPGQYDTTDFEARFTPKERSLSQGESITYSLDIEGASGLEPLTITLAWTDPVHAPGDRNVLVNDLDLVVSFRRADAPDKAVVVYGNDREGGDRDNNLEQVRLVAAEPQTIDVTVVAHRVVAGVGTAEPCQPFAIVVAGAPSSPIPDPAPCTLAPTPRPKPR